MDVTCPACGFQVLAEGYGSNELCAVCGWEDDGVQLANPTSSGGANRQSLAQAQAELLRRLPLDTVSHEGFDRDARWRPLSQLELAEAEARRAVSHWHTSAVADPWDAYWERRGI